MASNVVDKNVSIRYICYYIRCQRVKTKTASRGWRFKSVTG